MALVKLEIEIERFPAASIPRSAKNFSTLIFEVEKMDHFLLLEKCRPSFCEPIDAREMKSSWVHDRGTSLAGYIIIRIRRNISELEHPTFYHPQTIPKHPHSPQKR